MNRLIHFTQTDGVFSLTMLLRTARQTQRWLQDNGVTVLDWPANSPDLAPIETSGRSLSGVLSFVGHKTSTNLRRNPGGVAVSGQIVFASCISIIAGSQGTGTPLQTTDRTSSFFDSDTGYNIDLDISLAHPWSSDIIPTSAGVDGAAADRRADRKRAKYNKQQLQGGSIVSAIPLVMEHFGAWGFDAWKFLKKIAKKSSDEVGRLTAAEFIDFWSKRFSVQLQRCNANVISKKSSSLTGVNRSDFYGTQFFSH